MTEEIELVIADDNLFFAEALAENLSLKKEFCVKKVCSNLKELSDYCSLETFDVLILDVNFKGENALEKLSSIRKRDKDFKVIVITSLMDTFNKSLAAQNNVELFLSKEDSLYDFHNTIINCHTGTIKKKKEKVTLKGIKINGVNFTETKVHILKSLYKYSGKTEKEIAQYLNISESSLKTHKRQLYEMTSTKRIADLLKFGFKHGILLQ